MDREADMAALFNAAMTAQQSIVVRARHNRGFLTQQQRHLKSDKGKALTRLWDDLRANETSVIVERQLRDDKGNGYQAPCHLSYRFLVRLLEPVIKIWQKVALVESLD